MRRSSQVSRVAAGDGDWRVRDIITRRMSGRCNGERSARFGDASARHRDTNGSAEEEDAPVGLDEVPFIASPVGRRGGRTTGAAAGLQSTSARNARTHTSTKNDAPTAHGGRPTALAQCALCLLRLVPALSVSILGRRSRRNQDSMRSRRCAGRSAAREGVGPAGRFRKSNSSAQAQSAKRLCRRRPTDEREAEFLGSL